MVIKENFENLIKVRDTAQTYAHLHKILFIILGTSENAEVQFLEWRLRMFTLIPFPYWEPKLREGQDPTVQRQGWTKIQAFAA